MIRSGVEKKAPNLTIVDTAGGATVLALHTGRVQTFLDKAGVVQDQDTFRRAQRSDEPLAEEIACRHRIPAGTIQQQVLHPIRDASPSHSARCQPFFRSHWLSSP